MNIKEKILNNISDLIDKQNAKGLKKYGQSIEDCPTGNYDWQGMIIEELIDALQYQQKQMEQLNDENIELAVANENLLKVNRVNKNRVQELEEEIKTHAPHGRNYTNEQYVQMRLRVQELEDDIEGREMVRQINSNIISMYKEQNKRYREKINVALALLESVPFREPEASSAVKHLNKALEESP